MGLMAFSGREEGTSLKDYLTIRAPAGGLGNSNLETIMDMDGDAGRSNAGPGKTALVAFVLLYLLIATTTVYLFYLWSR